MADDERLEASDDLTISEVAVACDVDRKDIERRLRHGEFPNAWRAVTENGASSFQPVWRIPLADLRAVGLKPDATRVQPRARPVQTNGTPVQTSATPVQTNATPVQTSATPVQTSATPVQTNGTEVAHLRTELDEWQRRALVAEALAEERLRALADARQALHALATAVQRPHRDAPAVELPTDEPEEGAPETVRTRGNWLL